MRAADVRASGRIAPGRLALETARELLDFRGGGSSPVSPHAAEEQLRGAVAIHNILHDEGFAYLADEVGMGKTYVALGALALFRHFDPHFRVLVIAPRENIQKKWRKELLNFAARNVRFSDLRVKAVHGAPARAIVLCNSLLELVRETAVDPDRDFFTRLTSFSLPLGGQSNESWPAKRDGLLEHVPWLDPALFDLRNKEVFKDNFARAVNCGLPVFDLVIFDEGHNIKGGLRSTATRNRVLALAFGHRSQRDAQRDGFRGYGPRAKRVLFLSATPLEDDYVQLWNQLDVFGFGSSASVLKEPKASADEKRECARRFLIRRVTSLPVAGQQLTKNLYRREWRSGGVSAHDEPLVVPDEMQRLTVALVQKKVSELLRAAKFNNSFQIGMLASFESFLETARVVPPNGKKDQAEERPANFDDSDQTEDPDERLGIDVGSMNDLARSYRRKFNAELPHPKMDAVVSRLKSAFTTGDKALVFVRRVASVKELRRKLEEQYDQYLSARLRDEIKPELRPSLERVIKQYQNERATELRPHAVTEAERADAGDSGGLDDEAIVEEPIEDDEGGLDTFFAWFFRGEGPAGQILSGATLQKRFSQAGSFQSTFFEDNHVAYLLGVPPGDVGRSLAEYLGRPMTALGTELEFRAATHLPRVQRQQRRNVFWAFQYAAIELLAEHAGRHQDRARVVLEERYRGTDVSLRSASAPPPLEDWLELPTFWTALRERPALAAALWPMPRESSDFRATFREMELRRELLSAMARLGHPFIDLYVLTVNRLERLERGAREQGDEKVSELIDGYLDLLERQSSGLSTYSSFTELRDAAQNFELILALNEPEARREPLARATTLFGHLLRAQQPVGGMSGQVNETLVRQFRMPGYPRVLVTTDLLQEGEDLHAFCSTVHHYGISWMPSSMEQRVGRVDRVSSQTDRRLTSADRLPTGDELLQVFYPHLRETVEVLQVQRVIERLNRFIRLLHEDLSTGNTEERKIDVSAEVLRVQRDVEQIREPLRTAFPIQPEMLRGHERPLAITPARADELRDRFLNLNGKALTDRAITWDDRADDSALYGTFHLRTRQQPFVLLLRSVGGCAVIRCVSPVGMLSDLSLSEEEITRTARNSGVRVGVVFDQKMESYNLTIEGDVVLGEAAHDAARVGWLLGRVTAVADRLEELLLGTDHPIGVFQRDLELEPAYER